MTEHTDKKTEETPEVRKRAADPTETVVAEPEQPEVAEPVAAAPVSEPAPTGRPARRVVDMTKIKPAPPEPEPVREPEIPPEEDGLDDQFSAMMGASLASADSLTTRLEEGQQVSGRVVHIGGDNIFLDVGGKNEGYIARRELTDAEGELTASLGDMVDVYVVGYGPGGIELTRGMSATAGNAGLQAAFDGRIPVEGKVTSKNKGGFEVTVMGERAFCPISQIEMAFTEDPDAHVGQTYRFLVTRFETQGKSLNVVVSRAELEREERLVAQKETFKTLEVGQVREGKVRKLMPFGAFVDLGGVDGLVHISELSWERVEKPEEVVKAGQDVRVKVLSIKNLEDGPDKVRVGLSLKAVEGSPWDTVSDRFEPGGTYTGEVVRVEHFGAFVQLAPGIDGLVHISEMALSRVRHPKDVVQVGQRIDIQILDLDRQRQRISLSIKSLSGDPWSGVEERYPEGKAIEGTVENVEAFGVFVSVEPGLTGLIPQSELNTERGRPPHMDFRQGQTVSGWILAVDPVRQRLTLTRRDPAEKREEAPRDDHRGQRRDRDDRRPRRSEPVQWRDEDTAGSGMGTFADLFPAKLKRSRKD